MRPLAITLTICAAIACAGCSAWALAVKRAEIRRIEQDWGVHKPDPFNPNKLQRNNG